MNATNDQVVAAKVIAADLGLTQIFINDSGEFFTTANHAALSVTGDATKWCEVNLVTAAEKADNLDDELTGVQATIDAIGDATTEAGVKAILAALPQVEPDGHLPLLDPVLFIAAQKIIALNAE